jgi:glutamine synthetase
VTDPADLSDDERSAMGIVTLPATLPEAIEVFVSEERAASWLPDTMRESYLDVKRTEQSLAAAESDEENVIRYRRAY